MRKTFGVKEPRQTSAAFFPTDFKKNTADHTDNPSSIYSLQEVLNLQEPDLKV